MIKIGIGILIVIILIAILVGFVAGFLIGFFWDVIVIDMRDKPSPTPPSPSDNVVKTISWIEWYESL